MIKTTNYNPNHRSNTKSISLTLASSLIKICLEAPICQVCNHLIFKLQAFTFTKL